MVVWGTIFISFYYCQAPTFVLGSNYTSKLPKALEWQLRLQHSRARPKRNVIKEQQVITILDRANFDTDDGLIDAVHLLGLVMQGFVDGLRVPNEDEDENETSDEEF
ncbi:hypothetical protein Ddc_13640 [Ditylenchus destructor]|nr:hypothetical protein Ddc_13640 [Ditylenchus destructor]